MVVTWEVNSSRKWRDSNLEISTKHQVQISISELNLKGRWAYCMVFSWKLQVKRILTMFQDTLTNAIVLWNDLLRLQGFPKHLSGLKKLVAYGRMLVIVRTSKTTYNISTRRKRLDLRSVWNECWCSLWWWWKHSWSCSPFPQAHLRVLFSLGGLTV